MATTNPFVRRLRREMTGNPKKAALLGLLLLVAVWFWAPLVGKMLGKKSTADDGAAVATATDDTTTPSTPGAGTGGNSNTTAPNWQQVIQWIRNDPLMQPHTYEVASRDPFVPAASRVKAREEISHVPTPPPEVTPQQAGLALNSTVVGSRMKTALINGRAYREAQTVVSPKGEVRYVLAEIRPEAVILEHQGKRYELKLPKVEATGLDD